MRQAVSKPSEISCRVFIELVNAQAGLRMTTKSGYFLLMVTPLRDYLTCLRVARSAPSLSERYRGSSLGASQGSSLLSETAPLLLHGNVADMNARLDVRGSRKARR